MVKASSVASHQKIGEEKQVLVSRPRAIQRVVDKDLIPTLLDLLELASGTLLDMSSERSLSWRKRDHSDVVSQLDVLLDDKLGSRLADLRPHDAVMSEETGLRPGRNSITWIIDPLDGTTNYLAGRTDYGTIIGALIDGEPVVGGMTIPLLGRTHVAAAGHRTTSNGGAVPPMVERDIHDALVDCSLCSQPDDATLRRQFVGVERLVSRCRGVRSYGSLVAAADVIDQRLDVIVNFGACPWDVVGTSVAMSGAGLTVSRADGSALDFSGVSQHSRFDFIAAARPLHAQLVDALAE
jgi:myo-inositol-1(or 4)-monophosphatase